MKATLYRALLTLDPSASATSSTLEASVRVPATPDGGRQFHAVVSTADNEPFQPGQRSREVRISIADETAPDHLTTGVPFELWSGHEVVGRGTITRRAFV